MEVVGLGAEVVATVEAMAVGREEAAMVGEAMVGEAMAVAMAVAMVGEAKVVATAVDWGEAKAAGAMAVGAKGSWVQSSEFYTSKWRASQT